MRNDTRNLGSEYWINVIDRARNLFIEISITSYNRKEARKHYCILVESDGKKISRGFFVSMGKEIKNRSLRFFREKYLNILG